jgi:branched-chain amino acid transport system ATP-binding protein
MHLMLKAEKLLKSFGGLTAVANVDLAVAEGEVRSVIGTNGAGKTSLFNLLTGYWSCDAGKIFLDGKDITSVSAPDRVCLGVARTFQRTNIFGNLTIEENVLIPLLRKHGRSRNVVTPANRLYKKEIEDILESVALSESRGRIAGTLSHGHQRCLELAIALANSPRLLLLDEPAAGMSVSECAQMMELDKDINKRLGLTILLTEHDMNVVFSLSEMITVMHLGRVIAEGTPDEIKNNREVQQIYLGEAR